MSTLADFVETSLEHVPPEFERNYTLITDLDHQINDIVAQINEHVREYKTLCKLGERRQKKQVINDLFDKAIGFSQHKLSLASTTYDLVEKNVNSLEAIGNPKKKDEDESQIEEAPIGLTMPIDNSEPRFCSCRDYSHGSMIACESEECPYEWFHLACVGLTPEATPKGPWFCPTCSKLRNTKQRRRKPRKYY